MARHHRRSDGERRHDMPELEWEYGYFSVIDPILQVSAALFWRFRHIGWL